MTMNKTIIKIFSRHLWGTMLFIAVLISAFPLSGYAFDGCQDDCQKCHSLSEQEVKLILHKLKAPDSKIAKIQMSPVRGLWEVVIDNNNKPSLLYVDFSKKYLVAGSIVEVNAAINKTQQRLDELKYINPASVSFNNALIVGSNNADKKVIVFTDPD